MYSRIAGIFAALLLLAGPVAAAPIPELSLPVAVPDSLWRPLRETVDDSLQRRLESRLKQNELWADLMKSQKMAVGLVDLTVPESPRFARINGDVMMYAASLPKIAILLTTMQSFEDGTLKETPEVMKDLTDMIRKSSNGAATRSIDRVGGLAKIQAVLTDPRYELYDAEKGGGLWVGKRYAKTGAVHGDPLKGLSHGASATQVCRFYYLLATGRLISPARSTQMLELLSSPGIRHKFVQALAEEAPWAHLYRKSGTWKTWHSDSALVWGSRWRRYILVGLTEHPLGGVVLRDLVGVVEEVLGH